MQYPAGTHFTAVKSKLASSTLRGKLFFKDGNYSILNIKKKGDLVEYTLNYNNIEKISLQFATCRDMDKIIAFCRNENYFEPVIRDEYENA